jgi:DNA-binding winged helix-turn-helix (wHTH) protein/tetratricopeptide (TPR) repeat protein
MPSIVYRFGHCEVDVDARELRVHGTPQALEPRPFDLLVLLLRHRDRDVTTEELLDQLWHSEFVAAGSVASAVGKVRRAIGDSGRRPLIRTVHRVGYRFSGDVVEVLPNTAPAPLLPAPREKRVAVHAEHERWVADVLERAIGARRAGLWTQAANLLAVVLDIEPHNALARTELAQARAMQQEIGGHFSAALDHWREAERWLRELAAEGPSPQLNRHVAVAAVMCGLWDEAQRRVEEAIALAQARGGVDDLCRALALQGQVHTLWGQMLPRVPLLDHTVPDGLPDDARAAWWAARGHRLAQRRKHEDAADAFATAVALYRQAGAADSASALLMWHLHALLCAGRLLEADKVYQQAEACSGGQGLLQRGLVWFRARLGRAKGDERAALGLLDIAIDSPTLDLAQAACCTLAAHWHLRAGRTLAARQALGRVGPSFAEHPLVRRATADLVRGTE